MDKVKSALKIRLNKLSLPRNILEVYQYSSFMGSGTTTVVYKIKGNKIDIIYEDIAKNIICGNVSFERAKMLYELNHNEEQIIKEYISNISDECCKYFVNAENDYFFNVINDIENCLSFCCSEIKFGFYFISEKIYIVRKGKAK